jgi:hypothetical protein
MSTPRTLNPVRFARATNETSRSLAFSAIRTMYDPACFSLDVAEQHRSILAQRPVLEESRPMRREPSVTCGVSAAVRPPSAAAPSSTRGVRALLEMEVGG